MKKSSIRTILSTLGWSGELKKKAIRCMQSMPRLSRRVSVRAKIGAVIARVNVPPSNYLARSQAFISKAFAPQADRNDKLGIIDTFVDYACSVICGLAQYADDRIMLELARELASGRRDPRIKQLFARDVNVDDVLNNNILTIWPYYGAPLLREFYAIRQMVGPAANRRKTQSVALPPDPARLAALVELVDHDPHIAPPEQLEWKSPLVICGAPPKMHKLDECPICLSDLPVFAQMLECGHVICNQCARLIFTPLKTAKCPLCRKMSTSGLVVFGNIGV